MTNITVKLVRTFAKTVLHSLIFLGSLTNLTSNNMLSRMSSRICWLWRWQPQSNVSFIGNWTAFWGKRSLIRKDVIHPTLHGAPLFIIQNPDVPELRLGERTAVPHAVLPSAL